MASVLIADDEANLRKVLCALLGREGHETIAVEDGAAALKAVAEHDIDIVITDLKMPGMSGLELMDAIHQKRRGLPVIVITAHGTVDTAVSALKKGAVDYITKPFDKEELKLAIRKGLSARVESAGETELHKNPLVGTSPQMQQVSSVIQKVAPTTSTVLIIGESGTGKELVATALYENSKRRDKPFIKVNCAAVPKDLMESEFFGHEKGAFTGAVGQKPGRFELADGGTLFLDEIAEIPIDMQVKLLRALQEGEFERVGGVKTIRVDTRLIAATNRDLVVEIAAGRFREDLYYRLNVVPLPIPPLRERSDDIGDLVTTFITKHNGRLNKNISGISPQALAALRQYRWPGNVRELENVVERTLLFCETDQIELQDLPDELQQPRSSAAAKGASETAEVASFDGSNTSMKEIVRKATANLERDLITKALDETRGNVTRAAHLLRISRKGLQNKMKEFGLRDRAEDGD